MGDRLEVQPFKNIRYANTSATDQEFQVEVRYKEGETPKTKNAYANPQLAHPVAAGQNTAHPAPDQTVPDTSTVTSLKVMWGDPGDLAQSLEFDVNGAPADIHLLMVLQGAADQDAVAFDAAGKVLGGAAEGDVLP